MGSKTARVETQKQREDNTAELMENILTGGEISKAREAELQKAANYGRGVKFLPGSPTVGNLFDKDGNPILRTGVTAQDFTGRIVANPPTFGEALGDAGRALFGGQAVKPFFTSPDAPPGRETDLDFANMVPAPQRTEGIIPALVNTGGVTGIVLNALRDLIPGQGNQTTTTAMPSGFTSDIAYFIPQDASPQKLEREPLVGVIERNRLKQLIQSDNAPGSEDLDVDTMSDNEVLLRLRSYEENLAGGGRVGFSDGGYTPIDYYDEILYKDYLEKLEEGLVPIDETTGKPMSYEDYEQDRAEGMMKKGGLVPPGSGPQSEGIESLFKNK